jgi:hypothetical protein
LNTYAYVKGGPIGQSDFYGLQAVPAPIPIPLPPVVIPGSPENQGWVNSFNWLVKKLKDMCTPRGKCRLYDAVWDINPEDIYIDPSSPKPVSVGGVIKCFYRCDSGDHRVTQWPAPPGFRMTREQAMKWCSQEFDE